MKRRGRCIVIKQPNDGFRPRRAARANEPRCRECPAWDRSHWCRIGARIADPDAGMCDYGRRKRVAEAVTKSKARRSG